MSAFGDKADVNHGLVERPLIAISGLSLVLLGRFELHFIAISEQYLGGIRKAPN